MIDKCLETKTMLLFNLVAIATMLKRAEVFGFQWLVKELSRTFQTTSSIKVAPSVALIKTNFISC